MRYNTKQRELIISFFEKNDDKRFTASQIIENKLIDVGEATVFRYLSALTKEGILRKTQGENAAEYSFAKNECKAHLHIQCTSCGRTEHLDCDFMKDIQNHVENFHRFEIHTLRTVIYGKCSQCRSEENKK